MKEPGVIFALWELFQICYANLTIIERPLKSVLPAALAGFVPEVVLWELIHISIREEH
jgi:hypothetical protein